MACSVASASQTALRCARLKWLFLLLAVVSLAGGTPAAASADGDTVTESQGLDDAAAADADFSPQWVVAGPNQTADAVPSCSFCLQVFAELGDASDDDFTDLPVYVSRCRAFGARELWDYSDTTNRLRVRDPAGRLLCLQSDLTAAKCTGSAPKQRWVLEADTKRIRSGKEEEPGHQALYLAVTHSFLAYPNLALLTAAAIADPSSSVVTTEFTLEAPANYWAHGAGLSLRRDSKNDVPVNSSQNLVQSGGFERAAVLPGWPAGLDCSSTSTSPPPPLCSNSVLGPDELFPLCGWAVSSGAPEWVTALARWRPARGNSSLLLSHAAVINQTLPTLPARRYLLAFSLAGFLAHSAAADDYEICAPGGGTSPPDPDVQVKVVDGEGGGAQSQTQLFFVAQLSSDGNLRWGNANMTFTAPGNVTVVEVSGLTAGACGPLIDEVRVTLIQS